MGLAEKRLAEEIKTDKLPKFESKLNEKAGYPIKVNIDWASFTAFDQYPLSRLDIVFDDIEGFVKKICQDDLGKEALKEKLSTIQITNSDKREDLKMELKDNTFALHFQLAGDQFSSYTDSQMADYVEKQL